MLLVNALIFIFILAHSFQADITKFRTRNVWIPRKCRNCVPNTLFIFTFAVFFPVKIFRSFCWDAARCECVRFFLKLALIFINYINYRANLIFNILSFILCLFRLYCSPFPTFSLTFVGHSMNFKWVLLVSKRCSKYGVYFLFAFSTVISGGTKIIGLIISLALFEYVQIN